MSNPVNHPENATPAALDEAAQVGTEGTSELSKDDLGSVTGGIDIIRPIIKPYVDQS